MRESDFEIHSQIFQFKKVQNFVIINYFKKCRQYIGMIQQRKTSSSKFETDKNYRTNKILPNKQRNFVQTSFQLCLFRSKSGAPYWSLRGEYLQAHGN